MTNDIREIIRKTIRDMKDNREYYNGLSSSQQDHMLAVAIEAALEAAEQERQEWGGINRKTHDLKIHKQYFDYVLSGLKPFEIRKNDRNFNERDLLLLKETDNNGESYTGRELLMEITYITEYQQLLGYVVMGIARYND